MIFIKNKQIQPYKNIPLIKKGDILKITLRNIKVF